MFFMSACFETEEFPNTPQISFQDVRFVDTDALDSLVLSFTFQDGDGDIGLTNSFDDLATPYQIFDIILDARDSVVSISEDDVTLPLFAAPVVIDNQAGQPVYLFFPSEKRLFSDSDNRPVYDCENYEIIDADTFFVARNEFHFNFHVEFLGKSQGQSEFTLIDFREVFNSNDCTLGNFDGRIPLFDPDGREGVFTYAMLSQAFRLVFLDDSIKLRFYLYDRALNQSNIEESRAFTFNQLVQ